VATAAPAAATKALGEVLHHRLGLMAVEAVGLWMAIFG